MERSAAQLTRWRVCRRLTLGARFQNAKSWGPLFKCTTVCGRSTRAAPSHAGKDVCIAFTWMHCWPDSPFLLLVKRVSRMILRVFPWSSDSFSPDPDIWNEDERHKRTKWKVPEPTRLGLNLTLRQVLAGLGQLTGWLLSPFIYSSSLYFLLEASRFWVTLWNPSLVLFTFLPRVNGHLMGKLDVFILHNHLIIAL